VADDERVLAAGVLGPGERPCWKVVTSAPAADASSMTPASTAAAANAGGSARPLLRFDDFISVSFRSIKAAESGCSASVWIR